MKILVFGSGGMLGRAATHWFNKNQHTVIASQRKDFDISSTSPTALEAYLNEIRPDAIFNAAGIIKPQIPKFTIEQVLTVNAIFPRNLGQWALAHNIPAIHITTDCAFSGRKGQYSERDMFDAEDLYGISKTAGEPTSIMTLRTSIIGEEAGQSRSLISWAVSQAGKEVNGFTNHHWNGVTTIELSRIAEQIFSKKLYKPGLFHLHSPNSLSKLELVQQISDVYELNLKIKAMETAEACDRTLTSIYPLTRDLCSDTIKTQLEKMKASFNS